VQERWRALNEIDGGDMENMTYEEIADKFPEEYEDRKQNKFTYRYPNGESYQVVYTDT
jgi:broad specificity phosphatase PhoE